MIRTLADIHTYFRQLAESSTDIKYFIVGDSEQILSEDRSRLDYPLLWLETPSVNWNIQNVGEREYVLFFTILVNTKPETWHHQQYILHRTLEITNRIISKLRSDHQDEVLKIGLRMQSDPILGFGNDFDHGWRTRMSIMAPMSKCEPCHFISSCPVGAMAAFKWENITDGSFSNLFITNTSNYAEATGWTTTWHWKIDGGAEQTSNDVPGPDLGTGSYMLLWLTIEKDDCSLVASAYITNSVSCGESVPQLLPIEYC
jgi:hypothetical protein